MKFEENSIIKRLGNLFGFALAYFVFTSAIFMVYFLVKKVPFCCIYNVAAVTFSVTLAGILLKKLLR